MDIKLESAEKVVDIKRASPEKLNGFVQQIMDFEAADAASLAPELSDLNEQILYLERLGRVSKLQQKIAEALFDNYTEENYVIQKERYRQELLSRRSEDELKEGVLPTLLDDTIAAYGCYLDGREGIYKDGVSLSFKSNPRAKEEEQTRFSEKVTAEFQVHFEWIVPKSRKAALESIAVAKRIAKKSSEQLVKVSDQKTELVSPLLDRRKVYTGLIRPVSCDSLPEDQNIFYQLCIEGDLEGLQEKLIEIQFDKKDTKSKPMTPPWVRRSVQAPAPKTFETILKEQAPYVLHVACAAGQLKIVRFLMEKHGIQQEPYINGHYPLHYAAMGINGTELELLDYLESMGANINQATSDRKTALDIAVFHQQDVPVSWFCLRDVAINGLPDGDKPCSQPPLHRAVKTDNARIVLLLLNKGANPRQIDEKGQTPLLAAFFNRSFNSMNVFFNDGIFFSEKDKQALQEWIFKQPFGDPLAELAQAMIDHTESIADLLKALIEERVKIVQHDSQYSSHREPDEWCDATGETQMESAKGAVLLSSTGSSAGSSTQSPLLQRCLEGIARLEKGDSPSSPCDDVLTPAFALEQFRNRQNWTEDESACDTPSPNYVPRRRHTKAHAP